MSLGEVGNSMNGIFEQQAPDVDVMLSDADEKLATMQWRLGHALGGLENSSALEAQAYLDNAARTLRGIATHLAALRQLNRELLTAWGVASESDAPAWSVNVSRSDRTIIDDLKIVTYNDFCRTGNMNSSELIFRIFGIRTRLGLRDDEPLQIVELPCSRGKETFSILAGCKANGVLDKVQINAYDVNPRAVSEAQNPYNISPLALADRFELWGLPRECVYDFEVTEDGLLAPRQSLRERVKFAVLDASRQVPAPAHVVVMNNLLQHVKPGTNEIGDAIVANVVKCVLPGGLITVNDADTPGVIRALARHGFVPDPSYRRSYYDSPQFFVRAESS